MQISLSVKDIRPALAQVADSYVTSVLEATHASGINFGSIMLDTAQMGDPIITHLAKALKSKETQAAVTLRNLLHARKNPSAARVKHLKQFPEVFMRYIESTSKNGWLVSIKDHGSLFGYAVLTVTYHPPTKDSWEYCSISLAYAEDREVRYTGRSLSHQQLAQLAGEETDEIEDEDLSEDDEEEDPKKPAKVKKSAEALNEGMRIEDWLEDEGLHVVDADLLDSYKKQVTRYLAFVGCYGQQFLARGQAFSDYGSMGRLFGRGRNRSRNNSINSGVKRVNGVAIASDDKPTKVVLDQLFDFSKLDATANGGGDEDRDEESGGANSEVAEALGKMTLIERAEFFRNIYATTITAADVDQQYTRRTYMRRSGSAGNGVTHKLSKIGTNPRMLPMHLLLTCFHLERHHRVKIHSINLQPYKYDDQLDTKLVLDKKTKALIVMLTTDTQFEQSDVVSGKGAGTIVCARGPAGTGKTLTAEVVAEVVKKPLYRVQAAQLGVDPESVEENLTAVLRQASAWDAVLLLDEADVFIQKRGNELDRNAIVGALLRVLEYYDGIMFMTTNRSSDIDDAILSRCSAIVDYALPIGADAVALWDQYSTMFKVGMPATDCQYMADNLRVSGRTIHHLLQLVGRLMVSKNAKYSRELVLWAAAFVPRSDEEVVAVEEKKAR